MYLLDTDICIYIIRKRPPEVLRALKRNYRAGLHVSSISVAELEYGVEKSAFPEKNRVALVEFLSLFDIVAFTDADAAAYGTIRTALEKNDSPIGPLDLLIAAQALSRNYTLVTNNTREFARIETLKIDNWAASPAEGK